MLLIHKYLIINFFLICGLSKYRETKGFIETLAVGPEVDISNALVSHFQRSLGLLLSWGCFVFRQGFSM